MGKPRKDSAGIDSWVAMVEREAERDLPQVVIDHNLRMLERRGLVELKAGRADSTEAFQELFVRSIESLRKSYSPSPIDDPQGLVGMEMARIILHATPRRIQNGSVDASKIGQLSSVLAGLVRYKIGPQQSKKLMKLITTSPSK
jgi:hypothetical protein